MRFEDHVEVLQTIARYGHAFDSTDAHRGWLIDLLCFRVRRATRIA